MIDQLANLAVFLLPFERLPSFDFAGVTLRLSTLVILVGALLMLPRLRQFSWKLSLLDKTIIGFYVVAVISLTQATDLKRGLMVLGFLTYVLVVYAFLSRVWRKVLTPAKLQKLIVVAGAVTAVFGLYQFFGDALGLARQYTGLGELYTYHVFGFPRIQSTGHEPLYYANFLLLPILLLMSQYLQDAKSLGRWNLAALVLLLTVMVLTLSRGAYLGLIAGSLILLVALWRQTSWRRVLQSIGYVALSFGIAVALIQLVTTLGNTTGRGFLNFADQATIQDYGKGESTNLRIDRYKEAIRQFKEQPLLGAGLGQYGVVYAPPKDIARHGYPIVNNQYLETAAEMGLVGVIALMAVVGMAITQLVRSLKRRSSYFTAGLLAILIAIGVQYNFFSTIYIYHIWVLLALIEAATFKGAEDV
ncbi:MAG: O-antigen ligase family protein [Candidatus Berkelbacteria bacterium]|nr:MAG: O-antigen ligase family protein [Candidatus Berkelbacteria bacterium]QQG51693.1 MAG: O-antigen ligase family protein [Candidatus Berkelbacteria bacterium]